MERDVRQDEDGVPAGMREALRRLDGGGTPQWGGVDAAVLGAARARLGRRRSTWRLVVRAGMGLSAAAAVAMAVWMWGGEKLDAERPVTMVDALRLARLLEGTRRVSGTWDVNGDGVVDEKDVEGIARRAVRVGRAVGAREGGEGARESARACGSKDEARLRRLRVLRTIDKEMARGGQPGAALARRLARLPLATIARSYRCESPRGVWAGGEL